MVVQYRYGPGYSCILSRPAVAASVTGIMLLGGPWAKPIDGFSPLYRDMLTIKRHRADMVKLGYCHGNAFIVEYVLVAEFLACCG